MISLAIAATLIAAATTAVPTGKVLTDRSVRFELLLEEPAAEVWKLWTTSDGAQSFLAPRVAIEPRVGGLYQVSFDPATDPEGAKHGTQGARILRWDEGRAIAFEWTFPPLGEQCHTKPYPTWVEVALEPAGQPGHTRLSFAHHGFPSGGCWDKAFPIFRDGNWPLVLNRLLVRARDGVAPAWAGGTQPDGRKADALDRFVYKTAEIAAPRDEVYRAWTTVEGLKSFFAAGARVELREGGPYEIYFSMEAPEGSRGAETCTVVGFDAPRLFAFTWNQPPSLPALRFIHTVVNLHFEDAGPGRTAVRLYDLGFGTGADWEKAHQYFDAAWGKVLEWLGEKVGKRS